MAENFGFSIPVSDAERTTASPDASSPVQSAIRSQQFLDQGFLDVDTSLAGGLPYMRQALDQRVARSELLAKRASSALTLTNAAISTRQRVGQIEKSNEVLERYERWKHETEGMTPREKVASSRGEDVSNVLINRDVNNAWLQVERGFNLDKLEADEALIEADEALIEARGEDAEARVALERGQRTGQLIAQKATNLKNAKLLEQARTEEASEPSENADRVFDLMARVTAGDPDLFSLEQAANLAERLSSDDQAVRAEAENGLKLIDDVSLAINDPSIQIALRGMGTQMADGAFSSLLADVDEDELEEDNGVVREAYKRFASGEKVEPMDRLMLKKIKRKYEDIVAQAKERERVEEQELKNRRTLQLMERSAASGSDTLLKVQSILDEHLKFLKDNKPIPGVGGSYNEKLNEHQKEMAEVQRLANQAKSLLLQDGEVPKEQVNELARSARKTMGIPEPPKRPDKEQANPVPRQAPPATDAPATSGTPEVTDDFIMGLMQAPAAEPPAEDQATQE